MDLQRIIEAAKLLGQLPGAVSGTLPADPAYGPLTRPSMGGYAADPGMTAPLASPMAPPEKPAAPVQVPPPGLLTPAPQAVGGGGGPAPVAQPVGGLPAPQPLSPLFGAPQPVSPLVTGGQLPAIPSGGLPQQGGGTSGGGVLDFLQNPEIRRGLMEAGMRMLAASAPSTDPRSGSMAWALSQGLGGYQAGADAYKTQQAEQQDRTMNAAYKAAMIDQLMRPPAVKTPTLQTAYDQNGREVRGYLDANGEFVQVGGAKAATGGGRGAGGAGGGLGLYRGSEAQNKAIGYASYIDRALPTIQQLSEAGKQPDWAERMASGVPWGLGNFAISDDARNFMQAEREIAAAVLRKETGAAFTDDELRDVRSRYIPQPGDDQTTINNKLRALDQIRRSYWQQSGLPENQWQAYSGVGPAPQGQATGDGGLPVVRSDLDYEALPPGATFTDENGDIWEKP